MSNVAATSLHLYQIGIILYLELSNITNWWVVYHSDLTAFFGVELEIIQNGLVPAPITLSRIYGSQDHVVSAKHRDKQCQTWKLCMNCVCNYIWLY